MVELTYVHNSTGLCTAIIYIKKIRINMNSTSQIVTTLVIIFTLITAWFTHIIHCLMAGKYLLLIAGAFIAPVGVIHGIGIWAGVQW